MAAEQWRVRVTNMYDGDEWFLFSVGPPDVWADRSTVTIVTYYGEIEVLWQIPRKWVIPHGGIIVEPML